MKLMVRTCGKRDLISAKEFEYVEQLAKTSEFEHASVPILKKLIDATGKKQCSYFPEDRLLTITSAYLENPKFSGVSNTATQLFMLRATLRTRIGDFEGVMLDYDQAYLISKNYQVAINQAIICLTAGRVDLAEESLNKVVGGHGDYLLKGIQDNDMKQAWDIVNSVKATQRTDDLE